jgi:transcriptional regulator with XRE-family HTH domain
MLSREVYSPSVAEERPDLGEKIRAARAAKGWKQKHLAAQVDVEPITVSRWERGATRPDLDVIAQVAEATGKPVSYFLGGGEAEAQPSSPRLEEAVRRLEAAAERLEGIAEELRTELRRGR